MWTKRIFIQLLFFMHILYNIITHKYVYGHLERMLNKICPCLSWILPSSEPTKRAYQPHHELEQQQFMTKIQNEAKNSIASNSLMSEEISLEEQIQQTLGYGDRPRPERKVEEKQKGKGQVLRDTGDTTKLEEKQKAKQNDEQEQQTKSYGFTNLGQLQLNIPQYGQNYQLLKEKSHNASELLDPSLNTTQIPISSKLKINKTKLRVWRKTTPNCFLIEYQLPCSYSFFTETMNKKITPKDGHALVKESKLLESLHQNLALRYVCMNKIGMLESREFTYLKYTNNSSTNPSGHWQLCISINPKTTDSQPQQPIPTSPHTKPGKIQSISYIIEQKESESKIGLKVRTYVNLEIGVTVEKVWERILAEMKNYYEEIWEEAANNYTDQLV